MFSPTVMSATVTLIAEDFVNDEIDILTLLVKAELAPSKSEARRNVEQGGVLVGDEKVTDVKMMLKKDMFAGDGILLRRG